MKNNSLKKIIIITLIITCISIFQGCRNTSFVDEKDNPNGKIQITTTLFPNYDFAKQIAKDKADISLLLPPGVEAHSYDPTPNDILGTHNSDIFIYTSETMEPWASKIINTLDENKQLIVESTNGIETSIQSDHEHEHEGQDPHVWINPIYAQEMVKNISNAIIEADPKNAEFYKKNTENYISELSQLDAKISEALAKTDQKTIIYSGHFVFGYFTERYNLEYVTPYDGYAPNSEPTPKNIAELIDLMEILNVKTIYYEEIIDPKVAKVISEQTGANMLLLHGAHNVSKEEMDSGITYIDIMNQNLENLKIGLGYNEWNIKGWKFSSEIR